VTRGQCILVCLDYRKRRDESTIKCHTRRSMVSIGTVENGVYTLSSECGYRCLEERVWSACVFICPGGEMIVCGHAPAPITASHQKTPVSRTKLCDQFQVVAFHEVNLTLQVPAIPVLTQLYPRLRPYQYEEKSITTQGYMAPTTICVPNFDPSPHDCNRNDRRYVSFARRQSDYTSTSHCTH